jgi:hypothetical protein
MHRMTVYGLRGATAYQFFRAIGSIVRDCNKHLGSSPAFYHHTGVARKKRVRDTPARRPLDLAAAIEAVKESIHGIVSETIR